MGLWNKPCKGDPLAPPVRGVKAKSPSDKKGWGGRLFSSRGAVRVPADAETTVKTERRADTWVRPYGRRSEGCAGRTYMGLLKKPLRGKGNPPYPPLTGGQEKANPPLPGGGHCPGGDHCLGGNHCLGGGASPFYTPLSRGGRGGWFSGRGNDERGGFFNSPIYAAPADAKPRSAEGPPVPPRREDFSNDFVFGGPACRP